MRSLLGSLFWNALCPLLLYRYLKGAGWTETKSLLGACLFPVVGAAYGLIKNKVLDLMAALTLSGIVISLLALLLIQDPRMMLVQESFLTLVLGIASFLSLFAWKRPLMFYFGRYFECGNDKAKMEEFEDDYVRYAMARHVHRVLTVVWGFAFLAQFGAKAVLVYTQSTQVVLGFGPLVTNGIQVATIVWTLAYVKWVRSRAVAENVQPDGTP